MKELIIGCGQRKDQKVVSMNKNYDYENAVTLDINPAHEPDIVWDLENIPLPFEDNEFDEIHAYDVLEHTGAQGDYRFFFAQFEDLWRILKPDGLLYMTVPKWNSLWAWGDPGHKRVINEGSLMFLNQEHYRKNVGATTMSDYRNIYKADFKLVHCGNPAPLVDCFVLKVIKGET